MTKLLNTRAKAPVATTGTRQLTRHGRTRTDAFAWLRDPNWQEVLKDPSKLDAAIKAHLDAENAYTDAVAAPTKALQQKLFDEMKGRLDEDEASPPMQDGDWLYYKRFEQGKQYPLFCRRYKSLTATEEVFFDVNKAAEGKSFYKAASVIVSPDHTLLAIAEDTNGGEIFTMRILRISDGKQISGPVTGCGGDLVWANDNATVFYTVVDDNHRPYAVMRHTVGTDPKADVEVYREVDSGMFLGVDKTADEAFIVLNVHDHATSEMHTIPADNPHAAPVCFAPREEGVEYAIDHAGSQFFIRTNVDGAVDFKVCVCPTHATDRANWQDLVAYKPGVMIDNLHLVKGYLLRTEVEDALPRLVIHDLSSGTEEVVSFSEEAYSIGAAHSLMFDTTVVRFSYTSPSTPTQVFDYDLSTRRRKLVKEQRIPSGHNPTDYVVRRIYATSEDGTKVPVTVFYHKDTPIDGTAPLWLYGYGAYGISIPSSFSPRRLVLVNRGFVFAIAHVRGGTDKGYRWYLDGKMENKTNTFHDYIAAADCLIAEKFTSAGNIYAEGRSAGGMLMGAVTNLRPELWKLVHLGVPFVDVLNTMCDDTLPLTPPEWPEWGNPITDTAAYDRIAGYCPYTNLAPKAYPHTLITSSLTDYRVTYWEPAKYAAKMRSVNTADTLTIMKMEMATGHGGASGRFDALWEDAFEYAIVLDLFGKA
ncbi:MAG: prolyl oligopeptidase family serine peptidase [Proteobacteria bacterium]|nr:prolyl oligopeptidase family serine peptidase [Pseudomonadota bacterium]